MPEDGSADPDMRGDFGTRHWQPAPPGLELSLMRISCVADALSKSACGLAEDSGLMTGRSKKSLSGVHIGASRNCGNKMR